MPNFVRQRFQPLHKLMISGAWFFVVVSLLHLLWAAGAKIDSPDGVVKLYSTVVGEQVYDAWGLTYSGKMGMAQIIGQMLMVLAATLASTSKSNHPALTKARRVSHMILVTWAAWWAGNLMYLTNMDHQFDSMLQASMMVALTASTLYRAAHGWNGAGKGKDALPPSPPSGDEPDEEFATPAPVDQSQPTQAFFAAIAPEVQPIRESEFDADPHAHTDTFTHDNVEASHHGREKFDRFCSTCRENAAKFNAEFHKHVNKQNAAKIKDNASRIGSKAKAGGAAAAHKARSVAGRVKPVARTAWREARQAWQKTIASMRDAEPKQAGTATATPPTESVAS